MNNEPIKFICFQAVQWEIMEIPLYMLMGALGGTLGSLYNFMNYRLSVFRARFVHKRSLKVLESVLVALISATMAFIMIELSNDCSAQKDEQHTDNSLQVNVREPNGLL